MRRAGTALSVGLTLPIIAFSASSAKAFDKQAKAVAQLNAGLASTGNQVGYTSDELQRMASELQNITIFGDEEILEGVTSQLLTFTNIAGDAFDRTQVAALDLATRLGTDLKSAAIQLGKALNDPVANLSALSRSGIQFSKDQKTMINALVAGGKAAEAQSLILDELEKQYGGSAAAAAKAGTGPFKQFANILGDIQEDFGAIIVEALLPFVSKLKEMAQGFQALSPQTKKFIAILAGVAAAAGPLLALAGTILPAIGAGLALLVSPIGLVVAALTAVGVVIYKNWAPIKKTLVDIANYFVDLYNESVIFRVGVEAIISAFKTVFQVGKFVFTNLGNIISLVGQNIKDTFINLGGAMKALLTGDFSKLKNILKKNFADTFSNVKAFVAKSQVEFKSLQTSIANNLSEGVDNALNKKYKLLGENVDVSEVAAKVAAAAAGQTGGATGGVPGTPQTEKLEVQTQGLAAFKSLSESIVADTTNIGVALDGVSGKMSVFEQNAELIGQSVGDAFENMTSRFVDSLGLADHGFEGFVKSLLGSVTKIIATLLAQSVAYAITGGSAAGAATGAGAVVAMPAFIGGLTAAVIGAFAAIPKFEAGGVVAGSSFYGDKILARINSGELILNKNQQRDAYALMAGGSGSGDIILSTRLLGSDILISGERAQKRRDRIG